MKHLFVCVNVHTHSSKNSAYKTEQTNNICINVIYVEFSSETGRTPITTVLKIHVLKNFWGPMIM
jgi:hypothetical protein